MIDSRTLRLRLDEALRTDADFESFCLDFFPDVHRRFGGGMERTAKVNLLLQLVTDRDQILARLEGLTATRAASANPPAGRGRTLRWRDPLTVLHAAIVAVPVMKYALAVAGLTAVVALATRGFGLDAGTAIVGALVVLGLMTVLIVLAVATRQSARLVLPAMVLTWAVLTLLVGSSVLLIGSFFFSWPKASHCLFKSERCEPDRSQERAADAAPRTTASGSAASPPLPAALSAPGVPGSEDPRPRSRSNLVLKTLNRASLRWGLQLGFQLGRFELIDGAPFPEARAVAPAIRGELAELLKRDGLVSVQGKTGMQIMGEVIRVYGTLDAERHAAILIGIAANRALLVGASKKDEHNAEMRKLALSAIMEADPTVIPNRPALFEALAAARPENIPALLEFIDRQTEGTSPTTGPR